MHVTWGEQEYEGISEARNGRTPAQIDNILQPADRATMVERGPLFEAEATFACPRLDGVL